MKRGDDTNRSSGNGSVSQRPRGSYGIRFDRPRSSGGHAPRSGTRGREKSQGRWRASANREFPSGFRINGLERLAAVVAASVGGGAPRAAKVGGGPAAVAPAPLQGKRRHVRTAPESRRRERARGWSPTDDLRSAARGTPSETDPDVADRRVAGTTSRPHVAFGTLEVGRTPIEGSVFPPKSRDQASLSLARERGQG